MKRRTRIQYTEADKALMWERWRQGESLHAIARLFDRYHTSIGGIFARTGGIRPRPRCRSSLALALAEREEISRGVMAGLSVRSIARMLDRPPCTVSRELRRNGGRRAFTERVPQIRRHGTGRSVRSAVNSRRTLSSRVLWPTSCSSSGRRTEWPDGLSVRIPKMRRARCPTRRSIARSSSRLAVL
jgi:hypothetical protein